MAIMTRVTRIERFEVDTAVALKMLGKLQAPRALPAAPAYSAGPRLALARAVRLGILPPEALGSDLYGALEDLGRVEHWRVPACAD